MDSYTIWLCQCCMLVVANGECCDSDEHGGDSCVPLSLIGDTDGVSLGLLASGHAEGCEFRNWPDTPPDFECDCERISYSTAQCEGCGSKLHGERHAATVFPGDQS